jgi:hypothetical protein
MGISVFYAQQISHVASCEYCCSLPGIQHFQDKQTIFKTIGIISAVQTRRPLLESPLLARASTQ